MQIPDNIGENSLIVQRRPY